MRPARAHTLPPPQNRSCRRSLRLPVSVRLHSSHVGKRNGESSHDSLGAVSRLDEERIPENVEYRYGQCKASIQSSRFVSTALRIRVSPAPAARTFSLYSPHFILFHNSIIRDSSKSGSSYFREFRRIRCRLSDLRKHLQDCLS